uniref:Uncharacterized protein n=1 Tax=Oryza punctata TaxID=4537 RepID=A0A0E0LFB2_ORYPU
MEANLVSKVKLPLALLSLERKSQKHLLFDLSTNQTRGICSANSGWFLMVQNKPPHSEEMTCKRVNLPVLRSAKEGFFAFYVGSHGSPLVVAFIENKLTYDLLPTIHTVCPGDIYWSVYEHAGYHSQLNESYRFLEDIIIVDVALVGREVICVDYYGKIMVFNITEMTWRTAFAPEWSIADEHFVVAMEGQVVLVSCRHHPCSHPFRFLKLDESELDNSTWFLQKELLLEGKRKVYMFGSDGLTTKEVDYREKPPAEKSIMNIFAQDLVDGTTEKILLASIVTEACIWVLPDASPTSTTSCSKPSKLPSLPLALLTLECNSSKRLLFDLSTKQTRGATDVAFFPDAATLAFENGRWLLMPPLPPARENTASRLPRPRRERPAGGPAGGLFVFHVDSCGEPVVVACVETVSDYPTIDVAFLGDMHWTTCKNTGASPLQQARHRRAAFTLIVDAALRGKQVVCVDYRGRRPGGRRCSRRGGAGKTITSSSPPPAKAVARKRKRGSSSSLVVVAMIGFCFFLKKWNLGELDKMMLVFKQERNKSSVLHTWHFSVSLVTLLEELPCFHVVTYLLLGNHMTKHGSTHRPLQI